MNLSDLSNESLQSQIISQIRAMILAGDLNTEDSLPSIRQLAREHKISVITVQRAYENLVLQNLIHSRRGKGYFVTNLHNNKKKSMAFKHLEENMIRPLEAALNEGLEKNEIKSKILKILAGIKK